MNTIVCNSLLRWQERCVPDTPRIFTTDTGRPLIQRNLLRSLQIAQRKANLPVIRTFHETRHYFASKLIEAGFNLVHIARIIGHADIALTLRVYGHLLNQAEDRTSEYNRISAALGNASFDMLNQRPLPPLLHVQTT